MTMMHFCDVPNGHENVQSGHHVQTSLKVRASSKVPDLRVSVPKNKIHCVFYERDGSSIVYEDGYSSHCVELYINQSTAIVTTGNLHFHLCGNAE